MGTFLGPKYILYSCMDPSGRGADVKLPNVLHRPCGGFVWRPLHTRTLRLGRCKGGLEESTLPVVSRE